MQIREVGSGAAKREAREKLLEAARRWPPRDRCRAGVAAGRLGPVGNGSLGFHTPAEADHAYEGTLIRAALNGTSAAHQVMRAILERP